VTGVISLLPRVLPLLVRHLTAYGELAGADMALLMRALAQRLVAAAVALLSVAFAVLTGCAWIVMGVWNTPWREPTLALMLLAFTGVAVSAAMLAMRRWPAGSEPLSRLRAEWHSDQLVISGLLATEAPAPTPLDP
jgi:hypothetical protein